MPAIRSDKRKATSKGKSTTRPRQHLKDNVDPCEICGVVVSRKSDVPRHAKTHASDAEKLPCPWEGCTFKTLQKSNLDTHYRRHTQEKSYNCTDDPECKFQTCDPASLLRHRKRLHGYTPRASVGYKDENPYKHVHVRIIRGIESDAGSVASQFSKFSSAAASTSGSTSGSTSSTPASRSSSSDTLSPSPSPSPLPSPSPSPSLSPSPSPPLHRSRLHPPPRPSSPANNSSGESEVTHSSPSTPVASTPDRELTPEISSPTVLSMTSSPIYQSDKTLLFSDSAVKNYAWSLSLDLPLVSSPVSSGLDDLEFQYPEGEINDQPTSVLDSLRLPLHLPDMEKILPGYETSGHLNGAEGLELDKEHCQQIYHGEQQRTFEATKIEEPTDQVTFGLSLNGSPYLQSHNLPVGLFQNLSELYDYNCTNSNCTRRPEINPPALTSDSLVLDPLGLEIGFECGASHLAYVPGFGSVEPTLSSTSDTDPASSTVTHYHDITTQTTLVDMVDSNTASLDSDAGGQLHQTNTDANALNAEPNSITVNINSNLNNYGLNIDSNDVPPSSNTLALNHLNLSQWHILGVYGLPDEEPADLFNAGSVAKEDVDANTDVLEDMKKGVCFIAE